MTADGDVDARRPDVLTIRVDDLEAATRAWSQQLGVPVKLRAARFVELQTESVLVVLTDLPDRPAAALGWEVDRLGSGDGDPPVVAPGVRFGAVAAEPVPGFGRRRPILIDGAGLALELACWITPTPSPPAPSR
jgi:catechol 2,3-dioxygenase-like lactoylglutathione lyase family enzyme